MKSLPNNHIEVKGIPISKQDVQNWTKLYYNNLIIINKIISNAELYIFNQEDNNQEQAWAYLGYVLVYAKGYVV